MFRADLHTHTTCSDGSFTPEELVRHALERGLSGLSITDHDTVEAYTEVIPLAAELGLRLLPGIEFSATAERGNVHILGYGFRLDDPGLLALCERQVERREARNSKMLKLLAQHNMPISEEEMKSAAKRFPHKKVFGRPHIAQAMIEKGYVPDFDQAFRRWIGDGRPGYDPGEPITVQETIDTLHAAGGYAVIAHPHVMRDKVLLRQLLDMPFDGIEGYYAAFPRWVEKEYIAIGESKGWIVTGGSDFHGAPKPHIHLGISWVNEETFNALS